MQPGIGSSQTDANLSGPLQMINLVGEGSVVVRFEHTGTSS